MEQVRECCYDIVMLHCHAASDTCLKKAGDGTQLGVNRPITAWLVELALVAASSGSGRGSTNATSTVLGPDSA
jgi:hypothetical protein